MKWFNPRSGGSLVNGPVIAGGASRSLGAPPNTTTSDWVALVQSTTGGGGGTNTAPYVSAGPDKSAEITEGTVNVTLSGTVYDDGLPENSSVAITWSTVDGPAAVTFANPNSATSDATFTATGTYVLRLTATDGTLSSSDDVQVTISPPSNDISFSATHDAYLQNGTPFNIADFRVESAASRTRIGYIQFDLGSLPPGQANAKLRLTEGTDVSSGVMTLRVYAASSNNWTETNITSANAPTKGSQLGSFTSNITDGLVVEFDLSPHITGPGIYSYIIEADSSTLDVAFEAKEAGAGKGPSLLVSLPNDPPSFTGYQTATTVNGSLAIPYADILANASDPNGDTVSLTEVSANTANGGDVLMSEGTLIYNAPLGFSGVDTFELTVSDGKGGTANEDLVVNIVSSESAVAGSPPEISTLPSGLRSITFEGVPYLSYGIARSTDLDDWTVIATVKADASGALSFTDPNPPEGNAFYRLVVP